MEEFLDDVSPVIGDGMAGKTRGARSDDGLFDLMMEKTVG